MLVISKWLVGDVALFRAWKGVIGWKAEYFTTEQFIPLGDSVNWI